MSGVRGQSGAEAIQPPAIRLLFDQNLSHRLASLLADVFPGAAHVRDYGMRNADDPVVWEFAKTNGFTIVSKDADFHHISFVRGAPPRVVWIDVGNCSTERVESILRANVVRIIAFHRDEEATFLILE